MKKTASFLMALLLIFVFTACAKEEIFGVGEIKDGIYINEYMDMEVALPEGFGFMSEDEMKEAFGVSELYSEGGAFGYGAFAVNEMGASLNITFENTAVSHGESLTAKEYLDETLDIMLSMSGICVVDIEKGNMDLGKTDIPYADIELRASTEEASADIFERIAVKEKGGWLCIINAAAQNEEDIEVLFSKIKM